MKSSILLFLLFISINNYSQAFELQSVRVLKIMSYNAHNLFDTEHDHGKNDWSYLPKAYPGKKEGCEKQSSDYYKKACLESDWTQENLEVKLDQLVKVITNSGKPTFLGLVEVENENVLSQLAKRLGYRKFEITHGPDKRGIEVAFLFNENSYIKHIETIEHEVKGLKYFKDKPTRNILEVILEIRGERISFFVNHWPSQSNPSLARVAAAKTLMKVIRKRKRAFFKNYKFIVLGDFNVIEKDYPHAIKSVVLDYRDNRLEPKMKLRDIFVRKELYDAHTIFHDHKKIDRSTKSAMAPGTYFYSGDQKWNLLDRIFYSSNLFDVKSKLKIDQASYNIEVPDFAKASYTYNRKGDYREGTVISGIPLKSKYNTADPKKAGYSDHFPVVINLKVK